MDSYVRMLTKGDEGRLDFFLAPHTPFAYFMRSNCRRAGLHYQNEPYQADYFGSFTQGRLVGLLAHSWLGSVQVFSQDNAFVPELANKWRDYLAKNPREVTCFLGPADQVGVLLSVLDIHPPALRGGAEEEGLFALPLKNLVVPDSLTQPDVNVRRAQSGDIEILAAWRHDFGVEALGEPAGDEPYNKGHAEMTRRVAEGDLFVLEHREHLVSFCGVGGFLSDWKSVGPVWTPPEKRGRGFARAVVAGALQMLRKERLVNAVLFAQKEEAVRTYRSIGFDRIGDWRLGFLANPVSSL
ncbi:MAG: GNAT family N-acetyltransferase [Alphaproteobacteria bacterium]